MGNVTIKATLVEPETDDHWITALQEPGSFLWVDEAREIAPPGKEARMYFCCPCGCGRHGSAPVRAGGPRTQTPEWDWDGEREEPTLNPSVYFNQGQKGEWHGWLRNGVWEGC
jgi:hypothetical protein